MSLNCNHAVLNWSVIINENKHELLWTCQKILNCPKRAEDVLQDAFLRLSQLDVSRMLEIKKPEGYLFQVVRNISIDHKRKLIKESTRFSDSFIYIDIVDTAQTPEQLLTEQSTLSVVNASLTKLPERTRNIFELYRQGELNQKAIAEKYNISPTLVNFLIKEAIKNCRKYLLATH